MILEDGLANRMIRIPIERLKSKFDPANLTKLTSTYDYLLRTLHTARSTLHAAQPSPQACNGRAQKSQDICSIQPPGPRDQEISCSAYGLQLVSVQSRASWQRCHISSKATNRKAPGDRRFNFLQRAVSRDSGAWARRVSSATHIERTRAAT
jgi:hypothetical protein